MIGAEWAGRTSLASTLSAQMRDPLDETQRCAVCDAPGTTCSGADHERTGPERIDVGALVAERGKAQTRRGPGRPPKDPAKAAAKEAAHAQQAAETAPAVAAEAPVAAPASVGGVEAQQTPVRPVGADFGGAQTLSPLAPEAVRSPAAVIPEGEPTEVRDVITCPEGCIHPDDDPNRPDPDSVVLVNDHSEALATGAFMTLPGGAQVAFTRTVQRVWWGMGSARPNYSMVAAKGSVAPKPGAGRR